MTNSKKKVYPEAIAMGTLRKNRDLSNWQEGKFYSDASDPLTHFGRAKAVVRKIDNFGTFAYSS